MQVIQCLYKIGICTLLTANLIELSRVGAMLPSYYNHDVSLRCKRLCRPLSLLCSITDSIHDITIVTFFLKNFNYMLKFIVIKCRLRDDTKLFALLQFKFQSFFRSLQNGNRAPAPALNSFYFGMPRIAYDDNVLSRLVIIAYFSKFSNETLSLFLTAAKKGKILSLPTRNAYRSVFNLVQFRVKY